MCVCVTLTFPLATLLLCQFLLCCDFQHCQAPTGMQLLWFVADDGTVLTRQLAASNHSNRKRRWALRKLGSQPGYVIPPLNNLTPPYVFVFCTLTCMFWLINLHIFLWMCLYYVQVSKCVCVYVQCEARLVLLLIGQTIALSNSCFTSFKRCTVVGIRADQAVAQRTTRLTVTSKHRGLSPYCLVKMITAKRDRGTAAALPALVEAVLQRASSVL